MSRTSNVFLVALALIFMVSLAAPAFAGVVYNESNGTVAQLRQDYKDALRQLYGPPKDPSTLPNSQGIRLPKRTLPGTNYMNNPAAPCAVQTNQCPGIEEAVGFSVRSSAGVGTRTAIATEIHNFGLLPESVKTVSVAVIWDPLAEIFSTATLGNPGITVKIQGDLGGLPDDGVILATSSQTFATWQPTLPLAGTQARYGNVVFDVSGAGVVLPPGGVLHATAKVDQPGSNDFLYFLGDDGSVSTCPGRSSNYRTNIPGWISTTANYGLPYNFSIYIETCTQQPPAVCFTQHNWCDAATQVTIFGMPRTTRNAFATRYFAGQAGQAQPCTVKTIYPWFYENLATDSADVVVMIMEDDGAGLPGAVIWSDSLPYATLVKDLSGPTVVPVPNVVVTGEYYVGYRAVNPQPAALATRITFVGSPVGGDAGCASYNPNALFVLLPDNTTWVDDVAFFGGESELWVDVDICCPALNFATCTPASDNEWGTQGNGFERTNATESGLASLCGLTQKWAKAPGGNCNMIQPIIADGKVLIGGVDSLHCYDAATGAQLWAFGGFPYIVGELRGSPSVVNGFVYCGGAGAQAFSKLNLATGAVVWSRNLGGTDVPLSPGATAWSSPIVSGGFVYFTQETGRLYKLDDATGLDAAGSPLAIPGAPAAVPYNALTSNGTKLWVGTANTLATAGSMFQIDMATLAIDWQLTNPGMIFYSGNTDPYDPEGFPGTFAYEDGILYYHSQVRNDANGNAHYPQTGVVGAIDVALENGTGAGILWISDATITTVASPGSIVGTANWSGPAVGPGMIYIASRGYYGGTVEQDGISGWDKTLGVRVWYNGYTPIGVSGGVVLLDDIRSDVPVTVFCDGGVPYLFTSHNATLPNALGTWRLVNGNTGDMVWYRMFSERVRGTAIADGIVAVNVRTGGPTGGGQIVVFGPGNDRPRLQIDSQFVYRTATPGDGAVSDNIIDAFKNTGCINLNVSAYNEVNPPVVRVLGNNPVLTSSTARSERQLAGYSALLTAANLPKLRAIAVTGGIDDQGDEAETMTRTFARNSVRGAADPLFLTVNTAPGAVAPGATQSLAVVYDETGLTNNTGYTNFIEIASDDPDYYPQDPTGATFGLPAIQFELFIGCPDAQDELTTGLGHIWLTNFGAEAGGGNFASPGDDNFVVNGQNTHHFDGGWALVVKDSVHWAFDGASCGGYPRRAGEWGPTLPCGLTVAANTYPRPGGTDAVEEVTYNMIDLASPNGFFPPSSRQCGGWGAEVQRVGSQDPAFGDFVLTHIRLTNEPGDAGDLTGAIPDVYFGIVTDWDISSNDNVRAYNDGYAQEDNAAGLPGSGTWMAGHVRLDANHVGAGGIGSGSAPTFMTADIQDDQGHGNNAMKMMSNPAGYCATIDPASCANTDLAALWSCAYWPSVADGASVDVYMAIYRVEDGVNGLPFVPGAAGAEAVYREVTCRAKAFAGFGKGDVNCDGCVDLQDVVALGNIVDGILDPTGTAAVYTGDVNGDNAFSNADYNLLYDVVSGVQPASALANGWRF